MAARRTPRRWWRDDPYAQGLAAVGMVAAFVVVGFAVRCASVHHRDTQAAELAAVDQQVEQKSVPCEERPGTVTYQWAPGVYDEAHRPGPFPPPPPGCPQMQLNPATLAWECAPDSAWTICVRGATGDATNDDDPPWGRLRTTLQSRGETIDLPAGWGSTIWSNFTFDATPARHLCNTGEGPVCRDEADTNCCYRDEQPATRR